MFLLNRQALLEKIGRILLFASSVIGILILVWIILWADRGFDVTDEAYYVLFMKNPGAVDSSASLFGFLLHPLYKALNESIAGVRIAGILILAISGCGIVCCYLREKVLFGEKNLLDIVFLSIIGATSVLTYYFWWLTTPSYNWVTVWAGYLLSISLILLQEPRSLRTSAGLAGAAGVMDLMAKPPSAVAFALVYILGVFIAFPSSREVRNQIGRAILATFAAGGFSLLFIVHPKELMNAYGGFWQLFGEGDPIASGSLSYITQFFSTWLGSLYLFNILLAIFGVLTCRLPGWLAWVSCVCSVALLGWGLATTPDASVSITNIGIAIIAFSLIGLAGSYDRDNKKSRHLLTLCIIAIMPWMVAVGTGNDLIKHQAFSIGLPAIAGLLAVASIPSRFVAGVISTGIICLTVSALTFGLYHPYRLSTSLWEQSESVEMAPGGQSLRVDPAMRDFVESIRRIAGGNGFGPGVPLLDLTGFNPGVAVILGAKTPVLPWIMGSYAYSTDLLKFVLARMTAVERRSAWLVHSDSRFSFRAEALKELGIDIERDYMLAGEVFHPVDKIWIRLYFPKN